jgi:hypothetical protein
MTLRQFVDDRGVEWQVWAVAPRVERRESERRARADEATGHGSERRRGADRRMRQELRFKVSPQYAEGWLAFESPGEKRRLAPPPAHWWELSDAELATLCREARPTGRRFGRLIE